MDRQQAAVRLYESRLMRTPEEVSMFEQARLALYEMHDPLVLQDLFAAFDDATEQNEVMWGLIHQAEDFGLGIYLPALLAATPRLLLPAREWASVLHERVLNGAKSLPMYEDLLSALPEDTKHAIRTLLEEIAQNRPKLKQKAQGALRRLG